jgi:hypothetical protein
MKSLVVEHEITHLSWCFLPSTLFLDGVVILWIILCKIIAEGLIGRAIFCCRGLASFMRNLATMKSCGPRFNKNRIINHLKVLLSRNYVYNHLLKLVQMHFLLPKNRVFWNFVQILHSFVLFTAHIQPSNGFQHLICEYKSSFSLFIIEVGTGFKNNIYACLQRLIC